MSGHYASPGLSGSCPCSIKMQALEQRLGTHDYGTGVAFIHAYVDKRLRVCGWPVVSAMTIDDNASAVAAVSAWPGGKSSADCFLVAQGRPRQQHARAAHVNMKHWLN